MPTFRKGEVSSLPVWLDRKQMLAKQQQVLAEALLESGEQAPNGTYGRMSNDLAREARGVPILGSGIGGAIAGTRPDSIAERPLDRLLAA